ncbi:ABC transporter ATP-binding protein [Lolliginicoccus levis]|uniref:ABC transporter ATP-binding protein n=1 Tax=Lolliginicoccus levis TaxID=2919542 RepID=UPI00241FB6B5|nr:ABC transporter ATP-binding protein [Lolliginicoccus levis]
MTVTEPTASPPAPTGLHGVTMRYGRLRALDGVDLALRPGTIHGLLGRNGSGKTTAMRILAGHQIPTAGHATLDGAKTFENDNAVAAISFIRDDQRYPEDFTVHHVLRCAAALHPAWNEQLAQQLCHDFALPPRRKTKKLSRGMRSALAITVGLASRAPLTLLDEPTLGLDAPSRQVFHDRLIEDYALHPRTILLSTHLIDEVSPLLEHVFILDRGRVIADASADELRSRAVRATGETQQVRELIGDASVLGTETLGSQSRIVAAIAADEHLRAEALRRGVALDSVPLQQLITHLTQGA